MEDLGYDLGAAAVTIAAAVIAVLAVREIAVRVLHPNPAFDPLSLAPPIVDTVVCTIVAIFVFVRVSSYPNPVRTWRLVATLVLILSFIPDVLLVTSRSMGATWPEGLRSHDDARSRLGDLHNVVAFGRHH